MEGFHHDHWPTGDALFFIVISGKHFLQYSLQFVTIAHFSYGRLILKMSGQARWPMSSDLDM